VVMMHHLVMAAAIFMGGLCSGAVIGLVCWAFAAAANDDKELAWIENALGTPTFELALSLPSSATTSPASEKPERQSAESQSALTRIIRSAGRS
jgi:hypothetical protein